MFEDSALKKTLAGLNRDRENAAVAPPLDRIEQPVDILPPNMTQKELGDDPLKLIVAGWKRDRIAREAEEALRPVEERLVEFKQQYKPWVYPNVHFPFRLYYDGKNCRIFIIENILHNFDWLSEVWKGIRATDWFMVYVGWHMTLESLSQSKTLCDILGITDRVFIMYNDPSEMENGKKVGFNGDLINHNCWIDWNIFKPSSVDKKYDAIYCARALPFKRHFLASKVSNLALVAGNKHDGVGDVDLPPHVYLNDAPLPPDQIIVKMNESGVGLCLSEMEGASFTSSEYILCGLPVVSTKNMGGRSVWYTPENSIICEDTPESVKLGVDRLIEMKVDGEKIRKAHIAMSKAFRDKFRDKVQSIMDAHGEGVDAKEHFDGAYFDKLRRSEHVDRVRGLFVNGRVVDPLINIANNFNTDKKIHRYIQYYSKHFNDIRNEIKCVCEFGALTGESLKMWKCFFPNATIIGIDTNSECKSLETDRIKILTCDQTDIDAIRNYLCELNMRPDIVIDDASHVPMHQCKTFIGVFPLLNPGGYYCIEDLHSSCTKFMPVDNSFLKIEHLISNELKFYGAPKLETWTEYDVTDDDTASYMAKNITEMHQYRYITIVRKRVDNKDGSI